MADESPEGTDKKRQEPPPLEFLKPGEEQPVAPPTAERPAAWVTRPEDFQRQPYSQGPAPPRTAPPEGGGKARAAGIVLLGAAVISIAYILLTSLTPMSVPDYRNFTNNTAAFALNQVCSLILIWSQAAAILGGVMALQRMSWRLTAACAFYAMLAMALFAVGTLDVVFVASAALGIVAFAMTMLARREFLS